MGNLQEKKLRFLHDVGYVTSNCVYVKFNDREKWPIDYVRINDVIYSNPKKMGENIIKIGRNVHKALEQVHSYNSIEDLGQHIDPFIIKYHPAWIYLRETTGLTLPGDGEILCACDEKPDTFINHYKNDFLALGLNVPYSDKINEQAVMTHEVFNSLFPDELILECLENDEINHPDLVAFKRALQIKRQIDVYNEMIAKGASNEDVELSYRNVDCHLDRNGFPLIAIGRDKKRTSFDFRRENAYLEYCCRMAKRNPNSELGRAYKKMKTHRR